MLGSPSALNMETPVDEKHAMPSPVRPSTPLHDNLGETGDKASMPQPECGDEDAPPSEGSSPFLDCSLDPNDPSGVEDGIENIKRIAVLQLYGEGRFKFAVRGRPSRKLLQQAFVEIFEPFVPLRRIDLDILNYRARMKSTSSDHGTEVEKSDDNTTGITTSGEANICDQNRKEEINELRELPEDQIGAINHDKTEENNIFKKVDYLTSVPPAHNAENKKLPASKDSDSKESSTDSPSDKSKLSSYRFSLAKSSKGSDSENSDASSQKSSLTSHSIKDIESKSGAHAVRSLISEVIDKKGQSPTNISGMGSSKKRSSSTSSSKYQFLGSRHIGDAKLVLERTKKILSEKQRSKVPRGTSKRPSPKKREVSSIQKYKNKLMKDSKRPMFHQKQSRTNLADRTKVDKTLPVNKSRRQTLPNTRSPGSRKHSRYPDNDSLSNMYDKVKKKDRRESTKQETTEASTTSPPVSQPVVCTPPSEDLPSDTHQPAEEWTPTSKDEEEPISTVTPITPEPSISPVIGSPSPIDTLPSLTEPYLEVNSSIAKSSEGVNHKSPGHAQAKVVQDHHPTRNIQQQVPSHVIPGRRSKNTARKSIRHPVQKETPPPKKRARWSKKSVNEKRLDGLIKTLKSQLYGVARKRQRQKQKAAKASSAKRRRRTSKITQSKMEDIEEPEAPQAIVKESSGEPNETEKLSACSALSASTENGCQEDELPDLLPLKRKRITSSTPAIQPTNIPPEDQSMRLALDLPRHNWLEHKILHRGQSQEASSPPVTPRRLSSSSPHSDRRRPRCKTSEVEERMLPAVNNEEAPMQVTEGPQDLRIEEEMTPQQQKSPEQENVSPAILTDFSEERMILSTENPCDTPSMLQSSPNVQVLQNETPASLSNPTSSDHPKVAESHIFDIENQPQTVNKVNNVFLKDTTKVAQSNVMDDYVGVMELGSNDDGDDVGELVIDTCPPETSKHMQGEDDDSNKKVLVQKFSQPTTKVASAKNGHHSTQAHVMSSQQIAVSKNGHHPSKQDHLTPSQQIPVSKNISVSVTNQTVDEVSKQQDANTLLLLSEAHSNIDTHIPLSTDSSYLLSKEDHIVSTEARTDMGQKVARLMPILSNSPTEEVNLAHGDTSLPLQDSPPLDNNSRLESLRSKFDRQVIEYKTLQAMTRLKEKERQLLNGRLRRLHREISHAKALFNGVIRPRLGAAQAGQVNLQAHAAAPSATTVKSSDSNVIDLTKMGQPRSTTVKPPQGVSTTDDTVLDLSVKHETPKPLAVQPQPAHMRESTVNVLVRPSPPPAHSSKIDYNSYTYMHCKVSTNETQKATDGQSTPVLTTPPVPLSPDKIRSNIQQQVGNSHAPVSPNEGPVQDIQSRPVGPTRTTIGPPLPKMQAPEVRYTLVSPECTVVPGSHSSIVSSPQQINQGFTSPPATERTSTQTPVPHATIQAPDVAGQIVTIPQQSFHTTQTQPAPKAESNIQPQVSPRMSIAQSMNELATPTLPPPMPGTGRKVGRPRLAKNINPPLLPRQIRLPFRQYHSRLAYAQRASQSLALRPPPPYPSQNNQVHIPSGLRQPPPNVSILPINGTLQPVQQQPQQLQGQQQVLLNSPPATVVQLPSPQPLSYPGHLTQGGQIAQHQHPTGPPQQEVHNMQHIAPRHSVIQNRLAGPVPLRIQSQPQVSSSASVTRHPLVSINNMLEAQTEVVNSQRILDAQTEVVNSQRMLIHPGSVQMGLTPASQPIMAVTQHINIPQQDPNLTLARHPQSNVVRPGGVHGQVQARGGIHQMIAVPHQVLFSQASPGIPQQSPTAHPHTAASQPQPHGQNQVQMVRPSGNLVQVEVPRMVVPQQPVSEAVQNVQVNERVHQERSKGPDKMQQGVLCAVCHNPAAFLCSGCARTPYCSDKCQHLQWNVHKLECRR